MKKEAKALRNALQNGLGFDRLTVRVEMRKIIAEEIRKRVDQMGIDGMISREVNKQLRLYQLDNLHLQKVVHAAITAEVKDKVGKALSIQAALNVTFQPVVAGE